MSKTMTKTQRFRRLLQFGYFPQDLPPPFHTRDLAKYRESVYREWSSYSDPPSTAYEVYSIPRIKHARRNMSIINPISQLNLSKLISDNWVSIFKSIKKSKIAMQYPVIEKRGGRAVKPPDFDVASAKETEIAASYDNALVTDVSRFYGTLYTHSIAWALEGKAWCKANQYRPVFKTKLGVQLDDAIRKGQERQSIGIPIGPDTSRIISEIVISAIDEEVQKGIKLRKDQAFRNVDDWIIGFDTAGDCEDAIAIIAAECRKYELELNVDKTRIVHGSAVGNSIWPKELSRFQFGASFTPYDGAIEHFFDMAFYYANIFPEENVLNFAVKTSRRQKFRVDEWPVYEDYLLRIARSNYTTLDIVVGIIVNYNFYGYPIRKDRILKFIEDIIIKNLPSAHHAEIAWVLFLAKALSIQLGKKVTKLLGQIESSVCGLLTLDLRSRGLLTGALDDSIWKASMSSAGLRSNLWLLAYEADLKGWLAGSQRNFVEDDDYFKVLKDKNISFYDETKNVTKITKSKTVLPMVPLPTPITGKVSKGYDDWFDEDEGDDNEPF